MGSWESATSSQLSIGHDGRDMTGYCWWVVMMPHFRHWLSTWQSCSDQSNMEMIKISDVKDCADLYCNDSMMLSRVFLFCRFSNDRPRFVLLSNDQTWQKRNSQLEPLDGNHRTTWVTLHWVIFQETTELQQWSPWPLVFHRIIIKLQLSSSDPHQLEKKKKRTKL